MKGDKMYEFPSINIKCQASMRLQSKVEVMSCVLVAMNTLLDTNQYLKQFKNLKNMLSTSAFYSKTSPQFVLSNIWLIRRKMKNTSMIFFLLFAFELLKFFPSLCTYPFKC